MGVMMVLLSLLLPHRTMSVLLNVAMAVVMISVKVQKAMSTAGCVGTSAFVHK